MFELFFILSAIISFKNKVPSVPTPKIIMDNIYKALDLKDGSVVYDLGCGNGRTLFYFFSKNPKIKCIGFENNIYPIFWARCRLFFMSKEEKESIKIIRGNFFKKDLKEATHIFTYLSSDIMDKLLPRFEKELKPGTRLVSLSFSFRKKKPTQVVDLKRGRGQLGRELYVYQF